VNNLITRTITGVIFVGLIVMSVLLGDYFFLSFFVIIVFFGSYELNVLVMENSDRAFSIFCSIISSLIFLIAVSGGMFSLPWAEFSYHFIIPLLFLVPIAGLFRGGIPYVKRIGVGILSAVVVAFAFIALANILILDSGKIALLAFFCIIWTYDTFAYLVGIAIGKRRVCEAISPKKSWEGTIGGLVFGILCAVVFYYFTAGFSFATWTGYAIVICLFGTLGDYCESMLKRSVDVKDSGKILPGHGGILDRFDSAMLAAPFALLYLHFVL
jgi:phosphatidate cytidylyltransferase